MNTNISNDDDDDEDVPIYFQKLDMMLKDFPFFEIFWASIKIVLMLWFINGLIGELYQSFIKVWGLK